MKSRATNGSPATTAEIAQATRYSLYAKGHTTVIDRFTMPNWGECDILSLTDSLYAYEYEIKISRQDFKHDLEKPKHGIMACGGHFMSEGWLPSYFSYVVPLHMISVEDVPHYAGLYYYSGINQLYEVRKPIQLNKEPVGVDFLKRLTEAYTRQNLLKDPVTGPLVRERMYHVGRNPNSYRRRSAKKPA